MVYKIFVKHKLRSDTQDSNKFCPQESLSKRLALTSESSLSTRITNYNCCENISFFLE